MDGRTRKTVLEYVRHMRHCIYAGLLVLLIIFTCCAIIGGLYIKQFYIITIFIPLALLAGLLNILCCYYFEYLNKIPKFNNNSENTRGVVTSPNNAGNIIYNMSLMGLYGSEDDQDIMINSFLPSYEDAMTPTFVFGK